MSEIGWGSMAWAAVLIPLLIIGIASTRHAARVRSVWTLLLAVGADGQLLAALGAVAVPVLVPLVVGRMTSAVGVVAVAGPIVGIFGAACLVVFAVSFWVVLGRSASTPSGPSN